MRGVRICSGSCRRGDCGKAMMMLEVKRMKKRMFGVLSAAVIAAASVPVTESSAWDAFDFINEEQQGIFLNREYTSELPIGTQSFQPSDTGCFSAEWDGVLAYGAEQSRRFERELNWNRYSRITQEYEADINVTGNAWFAVHGWTKNRFAEFYVVEGWGTFRPDASLLIGTVEINGKEYGLSKSRRYNEPGIEGLEYFDRYWSVCRESSFRPGQTAHIAGTVDLEEHFRAWSENGMLTGQVCPDTCGLYVETYGGDEGNSKGSIQILKNKFSYEYQPLPETTAPDPENPEQTTTTAAEPAEKVGADEDGVFWNYSFEKDTYGWKPRVYTDDFKDPSKLKLDDTYYADGEKSLLVSGRTAAWQGVSLPLEPFALEYGKEYQIQAAVMQNSESIETFRLVLEYTDGAGEQQFIPVTESKCRKGEWTAIGGTFAFPEKQVAFEGEENETVIPLKNVCIYVETGKTCCDYRLDCVTLAEKDAAVTVDLSGANPAPKPAAEPKLVQYPARDDSEPYRAHQNKDYSYLGGGEGLKDILGPYFRVGATVNTFDLQDETKKAFYLKNFNSLTCENEMKPDTILKAIEGSDVTVDLKNAETILKFAEENGIGLRGHTFVWHSQTPQKMFTGTPEESDARIESMIKQTFEQLKTDYPELKLYAYDVCNEVFKNAGGGLRMQTNNYSDYSGYADLYGEDNPAFIINAFRWARQYAPAECKLYLNEYNEYMPQKTEDLCDLAKQIMKEGDYIDGIGMQSHLDALYPNNADYESAVKKFAALGLDIQITEIDVVNQMGGYESDQREKWSDIFRIALTYADNISSVTLWQPISDQWRSYLPRQQQSLFKSNMEPVEAYYDILDLTDEIAPPVTTDVPIAKPAKPAGFQPLVRKNGTAAAPTGDLRGDVDCNDYIDVSDVVLLMRFAAEDTEAKLTDQGVANGDVDGNGRTMILKYIAKQIKTL